MRIGLLGFPQAGKRTLFALLTGNVVSPARKAGEVVEGVATIRDPRVDRLSAICNPRKITYATNAFALCPDVVEGSEARDWLEAARTCDLLCLVVRRFESDAVYHPDGSVDATRDLASLQGELLLADMAICETRLTRLAKEKKAGLTPQQAAEEQTLSTCMAALEGERPLSQCELQDHEIATVKSLGFLTLKPLLVVYNVGEGETQDAGGPNSVSVSCLIEQEIMEIEDADERAEYLRDLGIEASGLDRVNAAAYDASGLMSFYTIGEDEVRAWTIRKGTAAPGAGGRIHSDIERGFIRVEIIKYDDLIAAGSEKAAKEKGQLQLKGKDYVMEDGDICHFLFNV